MKKLLLIVLALTCFACAVPVAEESVGELEQPISAYCNPHTTANGPVGAYFTWDTYNAGASGCGTAHNVRVALSWCTLKTNGLTTNCTNVMSDNGPHLLSAFETPGYNVNWYVSGVLCEGNPDGVPSWVAGQRVQTWVKWVDGAGAQRVRTATSDCL